MRDIFPRWIEKKLRGRESKGKIKLLFGARQTGKSTLLKQLFKPGAIVLNLQDRGERQRFERQPDELVRMLRAIAKPKMVLIDEIQKVPTLLDDVQMIYDETPDKFEFIITGSSARRLRGVSANLLPGRVHQYHIFPVVLDERTLDRKSTLLPLPLKRDWNPGFPPPVLEEMLLYGSLPGVIQETRNSRKATLEAYSEIYIEEEIRREALVRQIGPFARFLELAALESGNIMNLTGLSQQSGIAVATLRTFYQVLVDTFVGYWLMPFSTRSRKRLLTTPKFYFFDTGVRNTLARIPLMKDVLRLQAGTLFEQWAATELWHRCNYLGREYRLSFWRTVSGSEVDLILETPDEVIPIEIKWTTSPQVSDVRALEAFLKDYPKIAHRGFIVCRIPYRLQITKHILAIPYRDL